MEALWYKLKVMIAGLPALLSFVVDMSGCEAKNISHEKLQVPKGFTVNEYVDGVDNARQMAVSPSGVVFVGSMRAGNVYAVVDTNKDNKGDKVFTIAKDLNHPSGLTLRDGHLYVAEVHRIIVFKNIEKHLAKPPKPVVFNKSYPTDKHHGWKFIEFGPDNYLYVPVGAPCNVCVSKDPQYGSITRLSSDGKTKEIYAFGVRNSVGFDWHPKTKELWFTDNGRDWLGDDSPPDELNRASKKGLDFGFPYCHGGNIKDPEFGSKKPCSNFEKPAQNLGPHVASIGMSFYTGKMFPKEYQNQIFIAEHGSWNRSKPIGYRITIAKTDGQNVTDYKPFLTGWLDEATGKFWGRPADVAVMPDGAILVSDDFSGKLWRIAYNP